MATCKYGIHTLIVIFASSSWDCNEVVRWCEKCGAVVVDIDVDGRSRPGGVMRMKFPKTKR